MAAIQAATRFPNSEKKKTSSGEYPIYVRFHVDGKNAYSRLPVKTKPAHWNSNKHRVRAEHPDRVGVNAAIEKALQRGREVLRRLDEEQPGFTATDAKEAYEKPSKRLRGAIDFFEYAEGWLEEKRLAATQAQAKGSWDYWYVSKSDLNQFREAVGDRLPFARFTSQTLRTFDEYMIDRGNLASTRRKRFNLLNNVLESAVKNGILDRARNPFDGFDLPKGQARPKVRLTEGQIRALSELDLPIGSDEEFARDLYVFSFAMRGPRIADVLTLRWGDVAEGRWKFKARKTGKYFSIPLSSIVDPILNRYGPPGRPEEYVFGRMGRVGEGIEPVQRAIRNETSRANKALKRLAKRIEVADWKKVTFHSSRHSWAALALRRGVPVEVIKEGLGHAFLRTTEVYTGDLGEEAVDAALDHLTDGW